MVAARSSKVEALQRCVIQTIAKAVVYFSNADLTGAVFELAAIESIKAPGFVGSYPLAHEFNDFCLRRL